MTVQRSFATPSPTRRLPAAAAPRFVFRFTLFGPLIGYLVMPIAITLTFAPLHPVEAAFMPIQLAFVGILYAGLGLFVVYLFGIVPATLAGLFCLWWFNRTGALPWQPAAAAGLAAWTLSVIAVYAVVLAIAGDARALRAPEPEGIAFLIAGAATSVLCSLLIAPGALRRATEAIGAKPDPQAPITSR